MHPNIVVIGSTNVDFLIRSERIPVPGETVTGGEFMQVFGGKGANQAVGAARAGGRVAFVTCLGDDLYAASLIQSFENDRIDTRFVFREPGTATGSALIMIDRKGQNSISVAPGANSRMGSRQLEMASELIRKSELVLLQMEIPFETTASAIRMAYEAGKKVLFNLAPAMPFDHTILRRVYAFIVNEVEAAMVTGLAVDSDAEIEKAAKALLELGPQLAVITLGSRGAFLATAEQVCFIPAFPVTAVDTTAAGDVFCGSFATALAEGLEPADAIRFASAASAISVTRMGAQPSAPTRNEIDAFLAARA
jgi:ribokinase